MFLRLLGWLTCGVVMGCGSSGQDVPPTKPSTKPIGTPLAKADTKKDMPFGQAPPPGPPSKAPAKPAPPQSSKFEAQIHAIDSRNNTLMLSVGGQNRTIPLAPDAFICDDSPRNLGIPGGIQGLQVGSQVSVVTHKVGQLETIALVIVKGGRGQ